MHYFGSETADLSVFNSMGLKSEAVDALIEHVMKAQNKAELATSVKALDRTLRAYYFWVPQWFNDAYRVAYWNMYEHPKHCRHSHWVILISGGTMPKKPLT